MKVDIVHNSSRGYEIAIDDHTFKEDYELNKEAINLGNEVYLKHLKILYQHPVYLNDKFNLWWVHPSTARLDNLWALQYFYFTIAKLRLLFTRKHVSKLVVKIQLPEELESALKLLCEEYSVEFGLEQGNQFVKENKVSGGQKLVEEAVDYIVARIIRYFFYFLSPLARKVIYRNIRKFDAMFVLHPSAAVQRFHNLMEDLKAEGMECAYILNAIGSFRALRRVLKGKLTNKERYYFVDWYVSIFDKKRYAAEAGYALKQIEKVIKKIRTTNFDTRHSIELNYFLDRTAKITLKNLAGYIEQYEAYNRFAKHLDFPTIWFHAHPITKAYSRLVTAAAKNEGHKIVSIAPHMYTTTRLSNILIDREMKGANLIAVPDYYLVTEQQSKDVLLKNNIPGKNIFVYNKDLSQLIKKDSISKEKNKVYDKKSYSCLIILQDREDNPFLIKSVAVASKNIGNLSFKIKPHPLIPIDGMTMAEIKKLQVKYSIASQDDNINILIDESDFIITVYSSAASYALLMRKPVIWVPCVSYNSLLFSDFYERVGVYARDPIILKQILTDLCYDHSYYKELAEQCTMFLKYYFPNYEHNIAKNKILKLVRDLSITG